MCFNCWGLLEGLYKCELEDAQAVYLPFIQMNLMLKKADTNIRSVIKSKEGCRLLEIA